MAAAVLALQGAFIEHEAMMRRLGEEVLELRDASDLEKPFDRLILPGGESTTQQRLLKSRGMLEPLRERILAGMPTFGTCAGMILLAREVEGGTPTFGSAPVSVKRNAYGRQLGSFHVEEEIWLPDFHGDKEPAADFTDGDASGEEQANVSTARGAQTLRIPMTFIRAPYLSGVGEGVQVLAQVHGNMVAARYRNQLMCSFHPELDDDTHIHEYFLQM